MTALIEWASGLLDILVSVVGLVLNVIQSIIWVIANLGSFVAGITTSLAYIPSFILPFATVSVSLLVVYAILKLF